MSNDDRVPVYRSVNGRYFTTFGEVRRDWDGPEFSVDDGGVVDLNPFNLRDEKSSWWINRFDFQNASQDILSKTYRKSLPTGPALTIASNGQLIDSDGGGLLPYQGAVRDDRGDFLAPSSYQYPPAFLKVLPSLSITSPGLTEPQLYQKYLIEKGVVEGDVPVETPSAPVPETPSTATTTPDQPSERRNYNFYRNFLLERYPGVLEETLRSVFLDAQEQEKVSDKSKLQFYFDTVQAQGALEPETTSDVQVAPDGSTSTPVDDPFNSTILPTMLERYPDETVEDLRNRYNSIVQGGGVYEGDIDHVLEIYASRYGPAKDNTPVVIPETPSDDSKAVVPYQAPQKGPTYQTLIYDNKDAYALHGLRRQHVKEDDEKKSTNITRLGTIIGLL